jgi:methyltransferase (TIGR00027 family)
MMQNPVARTAVGPIVLAAVEHNEPPEKRLVDDDLAELFLPARLRWLVGATRLAPLRRLLIAASERSGPGLWANLACRKHFIGDKLEAALDDVDAVVVLGAGLDTRAYHVTRRAQIPVFEVDLPINIAKKATAVRRVLGALPLSVRLVAVDFERDDLLTALSEHGYHTDYRTFFICEGLSQYLTADGVRKTLEGLRAAASGSRLVFTYIRQDFLHGVKLYGARALYRRFRRRRQVWRFGVDPDNVGGLLADYGWRLVEQVGPDELRRRYIEPTGRTLTASDMEWSAYAEKD